MTTVVLPKNINPVQLAKHNEEIQGQLPLQQCERLRPLLKESGGSVDFSLYFMHDAAMRTIVRMSVSAECILECGRCLQPMPYPIAHSVELAVVADNDAIAELPESYEPLLVTESGVDLGSLIEDELLLNLPVMPSHSEGECSVSLPSQWMSSGPDEQSNPFAILKKLSDSRGS